MRSLELALLRTYDVPTVGSLLYRTGKRLRRCGAAKVGPDAA